MPHDKIKAAARKRIAETGEPYTAARRAAVSERQGPGYALAMSGEIHDWLTELRDSDPPADLHVVQALLTLMEKGASVGHPQVASAADSWPWALMQALDQSQRERMEQLAAVRRGEAEAVTLIKDIQYQVAALETAQAALENQQADKLAAAGQQIAEARRLLPGVLEARKRLGQAAKRLQARAEFWRVRTEVLKASYVAASGGLRAREAMAELGLADDASGVPGTGLAEITGQMEQALGQQGGPDGLMELRPGAPLRGDIRILFAIEPPGTALLIAVLHGPEVVAEQFPEALMASADMLRRIRAGQAPEAVAHTYGDTRSFLAEFYPGDAV